MGLESASFLSELNSSNPLTTDLEAQGDDHLRLLKTVLQASFPGVSKATYLHQPETSIASAATTDLGAVASDNVQIIGTATITSFGTVAAGVMKRGRFADALTLTHDGTALILPGTASIVTAANDRFEAISLGSGNWLVYFFQRAAGTPIAAFPSGTVMLFVQTLAPTGWTKGSTHNNKALRLVTGGVGTGGSTAFTSVLTSRSIAQANLPNYNLNTAGLSLNITNGSSLLSISGGILTGKDGAGVTDLLRSGNLSSVGLSGGLSGTLPSGGSGTAMDFDVQYVDVIMATKD